MSLIAREPARMGQDGQEMLLLERFDAGSKPMPK